MTKKRLILLVILVWFAAYSWKHRALKPPPGQIAVEQPVQAATSVAAFELGQYRIQPLASYRIQARVLAREDYRFDEGADLAPVDLALGWGPMSDTQVLQQINISQSGRFYWWQVDEFPIPREQIERNSANVHLVPANSQVEAQLKQVRVGQVIRMTGLLIEAKRANGWLWRSSLTRDDVGNGACELLWVENLSW